MQRRNEAGQALILAAVSLVVLLASAGVAVDMGVARYEKRLQQSAADAAALAGADNIAFGGVTAAGQAAAANDGFTDNSGGQLSTCTASGAPVGTVCVQINKPPSTGPHGCNGGTCDSNYVEAIVAAVHPTHFMGIVKIYTETVTARAVATDRGGTPPPNGAAGCVYTLGSPQKRIDAGVTTSGSVTVQAPNCGIMDNGNMIANGGANLSVTAGSIGVSGSFTNNGTGTISPTPVTSMDAVGDPISITPPCSGSGCPSGPTVKITNGGCVGACPAGVNCSGGSCTIQQGTYSDICISGSTVDFTGGLYIINSSSVCSGNGTNATSFQVSGNSTLCNSVNTNCSGMTNLSTANSGVTFFLTGDGSVSINGTTTTDFTAPNSGTYEGLLFYQDSADGATQGPSLSGTNGTAFQGALYFPSAHLSFGGNNSTTGTANFNGVAAYTLIVSDWLTFAGNPTITLNSNLSGLAGNGGPLAGILNSARLVE